MTHTVINRAFRGSLLVIVFAAFAGTAGMVVDGVIIARLLGDEAMAAFGLASPVFLMFNAVGCIFASGMQTISAKRIGMGDRDGANRSFSLCCVMTALIALFFMLAIGSFSSRISVFLGASGSSAALYGDTRTYLLGLLPGIPAFFFQFVFQPVMQLDEDKARIMISTLVMTAVDIIGDLLSAKVFHGGMFGMALATSASYLAAALVYLTHFRRKNTLFNFSFRGLLYREIPEMFVTGIPTANSRLCGTLRTFALNRLLLTLGGSIAVTALSTQTNMYNIFSSVGVGVSMSVLSLAGIFFGEEDRAALRVLLKTAIRYAVILVGLVAAILFAGAPEFVRVYLGPASEASDTAIRSVRLFALSLPLHAVSNVFVSHLQAVRRLGLSNLVCFLNDFFYTVLCAVILGAVFGTDGVWAAFPAGRFLLLVSLYAMAAFNAQRLWPRFDDYLFLPADFDPAEREKLVLSVASEDELKTAEEAVYRYCMSRGVDQASAEEAAKISGIAAAHISANGFKAGKNICMDISALLREGNIILRIRDNGSAADPRKALESAEAAGQVEKSQYISSMGMNNTMLQVPAKIVESLRTL